MELYLRQLIYQYLPLNGPPRQMTFSDLDASDEDIESRDRKLFQILSQTIDPEEQQYF